MSRTRKDHITSNVLEVVKREDGTFDLFLNRKPHRNRIPEQWLPEEICARFGYCCEEYDDILREVNQNGRTERIFGQRFSSPR